MSLVRRFWWVAPLLLAALAIVGIWLGPRVPAGGQPAAGSTTPAACSPAPCAAPDGFEVDVSAVASGGSVTTLQVSFKNNTAPGFGAGNYRPTSPADFRLELPSGRRLQPAFSVACPDWGEIHVIRGQPAGPETLCFETSSSKGAALIWGPDLGFPFREVRIPLAG